MIHKVYFIVLDPYVLKNGRSNYARLTASVIFNVNIHQRQNNDSKASMLILASCLY